MVLATTINLLRLNFSGNELARLKKFTDIEKGRWWGASGL